MQTVSEVMSRNASFVAPDETLQRAAQLMRELDVSTLPVCDGERLVGVVSLADLTREAGNDTAPSGDSRIDDMGEPLRRAHS